MKSRKYSFTLSWMTGNRDGERGAEPKRVVTEHRNGRMYQRAPNKGERRTALANCVCPYLPLNLAVGEQGTERNDSMDLKQTKRVWSGKTMKIHLKDL